MSLLTEIQSSYESQITSCKTPQALELVRLSLVGKKGSLTAALKSISTLPQEERQAAGALANALKKDILAALNARQEALTVDQDQVLSPVDLSAPITVAHGRGHAHPIQLVMSDVYDIFLRLGFAIIDGREVESDWYNFEVLNMPADHPARDMQDTFYLKTDGDVPPMVPRTHTSAAQIRYMETHQPPFKIIVPGKAYRNEDEDRTHSWSFYQVEGLVVGEGVSLADLKGTLLHFTQGLLGPEAKIRLRPSFFPYTEPSAEVDVWYGGEWLEILGSGMVHPHVLERGGIDPKKYSGFAFGVGLDRLAVIRYGLTDLRQLWRPNLLMNEQL